MSTEQFERIVKFSPAFDKRHSDPKKNYGIHGVELRMVLKGPLGATQFVLFTNWMLPHVQEELDSKFPSSMREPTPADLGHHWNKPQFDGQTQRDCVYTASGKCYYDGSGLNADRIYHVLLEKGSDGVWAELEKYYNEMAEQYV